MAAVNRWLKVEEPVHAVKSFWFPCGEFVDQMNYQLLEKSSVIFGDVTHRAQVG